MAIATPNPYAADQGQFKRDSTDRETAGDARRKLGSGEARQKERDRSASNRMPRAQGGVGPAFPTVRRELSEGLRRAATELRPGLRAPGDPDRRGVNPESPGTVQ